MIEFEKILIGFEIFSINRNYLNSGKARAYTLAIRYLCDFLNIRSFTPENLTLIKETSRVLNDENSRTYHSFLHFLRNRKQSSYLINGFVRAAAKDFLIYMRKYHED